MRDTSSFLWAQKIYLWGNDHNPSLLKSLLGDRKDIERKEI